MTTSKPPVEVRAGQVWADKSRDYKGREVRILELDSIRARVEVVKESDTPWSSRSTLGRQSRVLYDHRGLRGYRLVSEPQGGES